MSIKITLVTDMPVWVRPLVRALEALAVEVEVVTEPTAIISGGLVVNRVSALIRNQSRKAAEGFSGMFRALENRGVSVVNGADCFDLGCSKLAQARLFERSAVRTPRTRSAVPGGRALPGRVVLLKPPAGGYGRGIIRLEEGDSAPVELDDQGDGWIEQELIESSHQWVHRVEVLGSEVLYEARSPLRPGNYNYCLTDPDAETVLVSPSDLAGEVTEAALRVTGLAGMDLGGVEYLVDDDGELVFIDLNPVSGLHPKAGDLLGKPPLELTAAYLARRAGQDGQ